MRRQHERRLPVKSVTRATWRARAHETPRAGAQVNASGRAALAFRVDQVRIVPIDGTYESIPTADPDPIGINRPPTTCRPIGSAPTPVVLQAAVHVVVAPWANGNMIELANRDMVVMVPMRATVVGHVDSTIVADDDVSTVPRIHPQGMVIGMDLPRHITGTECLPPILAQVQLGAENPKELLVARIDANLTVIHWAWIDTVNARPGRAAVGGTIDAAVLESILALLELRVGRLAPETRGKRAPRAQGFGGRQLLLLAAAWAGLRPFCKLDLHRDTLAIA